MDKLQLAILWALWCSLHSLLISRSFTAKVKEIWGVKFAYYRLAFNVFSLITLIPVLLYKEILPEEIIFSWPGPWKVLQFGMFLASFILFYGGYRVFDMRYVLGTKQVHEMRVKKQKPWISTLQVSLNMSDIPGTAVQSFSSGYLVRYPMCRWSQR